jgi:hypothetical protein
VVTTGERRNAYRIFVRKSLEKHPLRRLKWGWENNIKMDIRETGCEGGGWLEMADIASNGGLY